MDRATFWATKSPLPEFHSFIFEHPAFDTPFALVANQFEPVVLGGVSHIPVAMSIKKPDLKSDAQPKLSASFARQQVGRDFKRQLKKVRDAAIPKPIRLTYATYLGDTDVPEIVWRVFVSEGGGITFANDAVQINATVDNPMRRAVAPEYDPSIFTGLEIM